MVIQYKRIFFVSVTAIIVIICTGYFAYNPIYPDEKLNVILITIDALRPDHLSCYGYKRNTSPNIDGLSKEGLLFTQAIAQGTRTHISLPSLHTSTYARVHRSYRPDLKINPSLYTLAEVLKKNGYFTMAIINYIKMDQLKRGWDTFIYDKNISAEEVTRKTVSLIEEKLNNNFFLWIHYFDPHGPYKPPTPYNSMFLNNSRGKTVPISKKMDSGFMAIPGYVAENNITDVDYYISQYDGEIRFVDEQIGLLWRKVKELNLDKNTILIITADHGEAMGERQHYFEHWAALYDEIIRVPLIIKCDKITSFARVIKQQVQSIDIAPTILELVHIDKPRTMQGNSLFPMIKTGEKHPSFFSFSECGFQTPGSKSVECIRTNEWKLIYKEENNKEDYELYNLNLDPEEKNNLIAIEINKFKFLNKKLKQWRNRNHFIRPTFYETSDYLTEETKEILKSLGYVQ